MRAERTTTLIRTKRKNKQRREEEKEAKIFAYADPQ